MAVLGKKNGKLLAIYGLMLLFTIRKTILLFTLLAGVVCANAQSKNHLFVQGGYTIPMGSFGSTTRNDAQFAKVGYGGLLGYYRNFKRFYVGLQGSVLSHNFDENAYDEYIENESNGITNSKTEHVGYAMASVNLILGLEFYQDSLWSIGAHIKPGWGAYMVGSLNNTTSGNGITVETALDGMIKGGLLWGFGLQGKYKVTDIASVIGGVDYYFGSASKVVYLNQTVNGNHILVDHPSVLEMDFRSLLISVGLCFDF